MNQPHSGARAQDPKWKIQRLLPGRLRIEETSRRPSRRRNAGRSDPKVTQSAAFCTYIRALNLTPLMNQPHSGARAQDPKWKIQRLLPGRLRIEETSRRPSRRRNAGRSDPKVTQSAAFCTYIRALNLTPLMNQPHSGARAQDPKWKIPRPVPSRMFSYTHTPLHYTTLHNTTHTHTHTHTPITMPLMRFWNRRYLWLAPTMSPKMTLLGPKSKIWGLPQVVIKSRNSQNAQIRGPLSVGPAQKGGEGRQLGKNDASKWPFPGKS